MADVATSHRLLLLRLQVRGAHHATQHHVPKERDMVAFLQDQSAQFWQTLSGLALAKR